MQATMRDASGRIIGTATTNPNSGGSAQTSYRAAYLDGDRVLTGFSQVVQVTVTP